MIFKNSLGVEIAGKDLRLAVMGSTFGKLRIVRTLEIAGFLNLSLDDQKAALRKVASGQKLPRRVFLSLPREGGIIRQQDFPVEIREKLQSTVSLQLESLSPWPVDEIYWSFSPDLPAKNAKSVRVTVAIIPRAVLAPWVQLFESVGLPLSGASLSSLACAHAAVLLWPEGAPTVALDCEENYVEGCLVQGNQVVSLVQRGSDTSAIAKDVVQRLMADGRVTAPESTRLLVFGASGNLLESVERPSLPLENAVSGSSSRFGAIATALTGLGRSAFGVNLIPSALRYHRSHAQFIPTYALLVLAALLGMLAAVRGPYQSMVYGAKIESEIHRVAPAAREVSKQQSELNRLSDRYRAVSAQFKNRDYNLEAMRELARVLPASAWLATYSYQEGGIAISGFATNATEIQKILEDSALFKDVQFTTSVTRDARGRDHFALKAKIEVAP